MLFIYRSYKNNYGLTVLSVFAKIMGVVVGLLGISFLLERSFVDIVYSLVCFALAAFLIIYIGHIWTDKLAKQSFDKRIRNKPEFAAGIVRDNPDLYEDVCALNPLFAQCYVLDESGKLVKNTCEHLLEKGFK